jgi:hypothetical protein
VFRDRRVSCVKHTCGYVACPWERLAAVVPPGSVRVSADRRRRKRDRKSTRLISAGRDSRNQHCSRAADFCATASNAALLQGAIGLTLLDQLATNSNDFAVPIAEAACPFREIDQSFIFGLCAQPATAGAGRFDDRFVAPCRLPGRR